MAQAVNIVSDLWERAYNFIRQRKIAYQLAFSSPAGQEVLIDFAKFCRANETCVVPGDHDRTLILEGRRECWLRIQEHMNLNADQLYSLYNGSHFNTNPQETADG